MRQSLGWVLNVMALKFRLGRAGIGKRSVFKALLTKEASMHPTPNDICYVHNFKEPRKPHYLLLPPGMEKIPRRYALFSGDAAISIPAIFESEAYRVKIKNIQELIQRKTGKGFLTHSKMRQMLAALQLCTLQTALY